MSATWLPSARARRFALVLNRYRWEAGAGRRVRRAGEVGTAREVVAAESPANPPGCQEIVLSLLALTFAPDGGQQGY